MKPKKQPMRAIAAISIIFIASGILTGCGEVVVFGHVVREGKPKPTPDTEPTAADSKQSDSQRAESEPALPKQGESGRSDAASVDSKRSDSQAAASPKPAMKAVAGPAPQRLNALTVALAPEAATKANSDSKFNRDVLIATIKRELRALKVLDESGSQAAAADIVIDDYDVHRTTNVIFLGKMSYGGTLTGSLHVRDAQGNDVSVKHIEAKSRFSIPAEGEVENPLEPLYRQFAIQTGNALTGKASKSDE